jgi:DNA polymerase-3 subunit chi
MTDISFYQVLNGTPGAVDATVPMLLEKVIAAGHKVVIRCPSEDRMERLNQTLWTYKESSFLPHGSKNDGHQNAQPIFITDEVSEAPNDADILLLVSGAEAPDFSNYARVLDMFEASDIQKNNARKRWSSYKEKGYPLAYFSHEDGKWNKKA